MAELSLFTHDHILFNCLKCFPLLDINFVADSKNKNPFRANGFLTSGFIRSAPGKNAWVLNKF